MRQVKKCCSRNHLISFTMNFLWKYSLNAMNFVHENKTLDFMGKDLKGKELGVGICQRKYGLYTARFVSKRNGKSVQRYFPRLQECRKWYADSKFEDEHGGINASGDMTVTAWFDYWIENIKGDSIIQPVCFHFADRITDRRDDRLKMVRH